MQAEIQGAWGAVFWFAKKRQFAQKQEATVSEDEFWCVTLRIGGQLGNAMIWYC